MKQLPSLNERLKDYLKSDSKITLYKDGTTTLYSKASLEKDILFARHTFKKYGLKQGDMVLFQINAATKKAFLASFFALLSMGVAPVLLTAARSRDHVTRLKRVAGDNPTAPIIADSETAEFIKFFWKDLDKNRIITVVENVEKYPDDMENEIEYADVDPNALALVLYSSGSTTDPKGVMMNNQRFLLMLKNLGKALKTSPKDIWLEWLPLEHAFGIVTLIVIPMYYNLGAVHMNAVEFIQNPKSWFDAVSKTRATKTAAPNFAYPLLKQAIQGNEKWDLSCLDFILNGGEPLSKKVCKEFTDSMKHFGFKENTIVPLYGLTEALGAVTFNMEHEYPEVYAEKLTAGIDFNLDVLKANIADIVCQGRAIPEMQIRISNDLGEPLNDYVVGNILVKSDYICTGYLSKDSSDLFIDGWLDTGDLGFLSEGLLYVVGRKKDMFFIHGKNIYLRDIEQVITSKFGYRCAVCGDNDFASGNNYVYLFVESQDPADIPVKELKEHVFSEMGFGLNKVIPMKKLITTGTGKIAKEKMLLAFKNGEITGV